MKKKKKTIKINAKKYGLTSKIGSQGARKHKFNERYFENIDSEEKAYWLGFIAADGCVYKNKQSYRLQINLKGSDIDHLKKFQKAICSDYKITEKKVGKAQSNTCQLKINSTKMCNDLIKNNIIERKSIIFEPPILNKNLMNHFIRGYFDGDGWITSYKRKDSNGYRNEVGIIGGKKALNYFIDFLPKGFSKYEKYKDDKIIQISGSSIKTISETYNYLYENATIFLDRKKNVFENIMSRLTEM